MKEKEQKSRILHRFLALQHKKCTFFAFFFKNICVYGFFVVPLHPLSKRKCAGCSSARLECLLWEQEFVISNLAIPTNQEEKQMSFSSFFAIPCTSYKIRST